MNRPTAIGPEYLGPLDHAVKSILDRGLSVVIDIHPESDCKEKLAKNDDSVQQFADFWRVGPHSTRPGVRIKSFSKFSTNRK